MTCGIHVGLEPPGPPSQPHIYICPLLPYKEEWLYTQLPTDTLQGGVAIYPYYGTGVLVWSVSALSYTPGHQEDSTLVPRPLGSGPQRRMQVQLCPQL